MPRQYSTYLIKSFGKSLHRSSKSVIIFLSLILLYFSSLVLAGSPYAGLRSFLETAGSDEIPRERLFGRGRGGRADGERGRPGRGEDEGGEGGEGEDG